MYSTFQSHEPEFDYLKSLEIEEKINKIRWLKRKNPAHFLLSTNDKTIKLWKVSERDKRVEGYNTKEENGTIRDPACITALRVRDSISFLFLFITHRCKCATITVIFNYEIYYETSSVIIPSV